MKKITLLALSGLLLSFTSCFKDTGAPQKVKDAFEMKFPTATMVKWDKESDTEWEAEFKMNGIDYSSNFMEDGSWTETEYKVGEAEVPSNVMEALNAKFKGYDVKKMEFSETADSRVYEFDIEKDGKEMEVSINANGTIVNMDGSGEGNGNGNEMEANAPQNIKDAFAKKFPTATNVSWDKESDTEWEAEFKMNNKEYSSNFMMDGSWTETEYEVSEAEVPKMVMEVLKTNFKGYDVEEMELSETADGKVYEFGLEKDGKEMEVAIDTSGKITKKEEKKDEDGDTEGSDEDND